MFIAVKNSVESFHIPLNYLVIILIISFTNSFAEEIMYRFAINGILMGNSSKLIILSASAIFFGLPHYWGHPSGLLGVLMSACLGYILSKATYETNGLGIAWFIHFIQDIIIFTGLFMMKE